MLRFVCLLFAACLLSPALAQTPLLPASGNVFLHGSFIRAKGRLLLSVDNLTMPSGATTTLTPARIKVIRILPSTRYIGVRRSSLRTGKIVTVEAKDSQAGQPVAVIAVWNAGGAGEVGSPRNSEQADEAAQADAPRAYPQASLQIMVEDYNDLLVKTQEACKNRHAASQASDTIIAITSKAKESELPDLQVQFDDAFNDMKRYTSEQEELTHQSLILKDKLTAFGNFASLYHETRVCLPPDEVVAPDRDQRIKAENLRFIEKR